jgi:hypothetical protein
MIYDFSNFKCRCSAITQMLSEKQGEAPLSEIQLARIAELDGKEKITDKQKAELAILVFRRDKPKDLVLSDTCIAYLMEHYAWVTEQAVCVTKEMDIDYFKKGKLQEDEGIKLLSDVDGVEYTKNAVRLSNDFLTGEPDIILGVDIYKANRLYDTKLSWDYPGFLKKVNTPIENGNKQQVQGYLDLTNCTDGAITDVLVNMPDTIINDYRYRLAKKLDAIDMESPSFLIAEATMLKSMMFDRIDKRKRVFKKKVDPFTGFERQKVYDKVKICREWLNKFHEMYNKLNN